MSSKRSIMRIQLDSAGKDRLEAICSKRGMTQIALMSRLVNWFSSQDEFVQTSVLQTLSSESIAALAQSLIKKTASHGSGKLRQDIALPSVMSHSWY
jgi:hypothetical protein